ncbi:alternate-type signal peptide domain-containing protein [Salinibacterium sp. G-O1]|uniref:alternate-type signal peptide domain-containing protein n=1 Tax=Salinibacterium sp. G-O1 TaxID=3046208 RepID=UPI0024B8CDCF|nr:alternate-type signal peptide domain-containing protein [Salinibacterium sp. G-O1]MDJ0335657.1 alternate-type signal peptide domain-containing protein [Salinibacterium sp. G-O1]
MNKLIKGAVATAAGVALLMGGAGTFAYWNDSVGITGGTITAGNLKVAAPATAPSTDGWTVQKNGTGTATTVSTISSFVASPGDKFTLTKTVNVTATGNNLTATLALGAGSITAATTGAADVALAAYLTKTATIAASGTGIAAIGSTGTYSITPGTAGITNSPVTVTVTITYPKDAATVTTAGPNSTAVLNEKASMLGSVNLAGLTVTVDQQ